MMAFWYPEVAFRSASGKPRFGARFGEVFFCTGLFCVLGFREGFGVQGL